MRARMKSALEFGPVKRRQQFAPKASPKWRRGWLPFAVAALVIAVLAEASAQKVNINMNVAPRVTAHPNIKIGPPTSINAPKININTPPNINTPKVNINTPPNINTGSRVNINTAPGPRVNQPTGYGTPVGVHVNRRYVAPQADNDNPPSQRRARKKIVE